MCTVSYVPAKESIILTSNRDEHIARGNTLPPQPHIHRNKKIVYPKDEKGNGTWIGLNEDNCAAVLLNGAFEKHTRNPPYKHSRALLIPYILQSANPIKALENYDLQGIEPFTLVIFLNGQLIEYRWNETRLFEKELNVQSAYCWNSVTLYSEETEKLNNKELNKLTAGNVTATEIFEFHKRKKYELQMPVNSSINDIKTISISQIVLTDGGNDFVYHDYLQPFVQPEEQ